MILYAITTAAMKGCERAKKEKEEKEKERKEKERKEKKNNNN